MSGPCESRVVAVVDPARVRSEADAPRAFVAVAVAHGVPARALAPVVQAARRRIAATAPAQRPPPFLKLVAPGPEPGCARVLLGRAPTDDNCALRQQLQLPPALCGVEVRVVRAPAQPPLSKAQAERWAAAEPGAWPTQYRPLAPDELPPVPLEESVVRAAEAHMRVALAEARRARARGDVCSFCCAQHTHMLCGDVFADCVAA